ncbi:MAG: N-acetylmuramoyl-L-alanine amidase [Bacteroidia bacterium]|nr:N-acetylmuramoyl-L-alanine amidase [Bacteroidia bacterium]
MKNRRKIAVSAAVIFLLSACGLIISVFSAGKNGVQEEILPNDDKVNVVCIDPGHGGHDPGCHGASVHEKNIALAIALKLGAQIEKQYPDVKVIYTRKTDVFVELHKRAEIANKAGADLFICIHCNAGPSEASGSETYALGLHKTEANLAVAKRENDVVMMEGDYQKNYEGFDVNSPEGSIIFSLYQNAYLNRSLSFAAKCQKYFKQDAQRNDRGVKQAGFLVLWKSAMPAVLIETGFLTNVKEEKYLMESANQDVMATSIFKAFSEYKAEIEGSVVTVKPPVNNDKPKENDNKGQKTEVKPSAENEVTYRVQFMSIPEKLPSTDSRIRNLEDVVMYRNGNLYSYTSGRFENMEKATQHQVVVRKSGYKDAFVVVFKGETRITLREAQAMSAN